jgi:hypothetical protein
LQLENLKVEAGQLTSDNKSLFSKLSDANNSLQKNKDNQQSTKSLLSNECAEVKAELKKLQSNHTELQGKHYDLQQTNTDLENNHAELQRDHKKLQTHNENLNGATENLNDATENLNELQGDHKKLQGDFIKLSILNDKLEKDIKSLNGATESLNGATENLKTLQAERDDLQQTNAALQIETAKVDGFKSEIETQRTEILGFKLNSTKQENEIKKIANSKWFTYTFLLVTALATLGFAIREMLGGDILGNAGHWSEYIPRVLTAMVLAVGMIWIAFSDLPKNRKIASMLFYGACEWVSFSNALDLPRMVSQMDSSQWLDVFGITIFSFLLPFTTYQLAHIQTESVKKYGLFLILSKMEAVLVQHKVTDIVKFKNDFTEKLI